MEKIKEQLIDIIKKLIEDSVEIKENLGFFDMGLSSLTVFTLCEEIRLRFKIECDETDLFNYPNIYELSEYIDLKLQGGYL